jgi:hypothetical protein
MTVGVGRQCGCLYYPGNQVRMHSVEATSGTATAAAGPVAVAACRAPASRPDCCVRCKRGSVAEAAVQADCTVATTTGDQQHQLSTNSRDELWLWLLAAVAAVKPAAAAAVGSVVNSGLGSIRRHQGQRQQQSASHCQWGFTCMWHEAWQSLQHCCYCFSHVC